MLLVRLKDLVDLFCEHQQRCRLCEGLLLLVQFTLQATNLASLFLILSLQVALISHARSVGAIRILSGLAPAGNLLGIQTSLVAEAPPAQATHRNRLNGSS
ncbi:hypothetical protein VB716_16625 [Synechococcus sp. CCY9201]|uniref:hypothetical protein n=1 Tax=Synechococcus sp. CCY9201 TaxID=174697 RepID=UPI002B21EDCB|nr:hypothetical protein [Synechococcus sp. CCY9201]MEA5475844.1 hypothetical protein [Synechococcus sp. CCY9201]